MLLCHRPILAQVVGMNWIEIPAGKYTLLKGRAKKSSCQIELLVRCVLHLCMSFILTDDGQMGPVHITRTGG